MHPKRADTMAVSGLRFENALVGSEWATAVLLCTNKGADSMAVSGLRFENALVGSEWATAVLLCNSPLALHGAHFRQGTLILSQSGRLLPAH